MPDRVKLELPCFLPGDKQVQASARILENGDIHIRLKKPEDSLKLVQMARERIPVAVAILHNQPKETDEQPA